MTGDSQSKMTLKSTSASTRSCSYIRENDWNLGVSVASHLSLRRGVWLEERASKILLSFVVLLQHCFQELWQWNQIFQCWDWRRMISERLFRTLDSRQSLGPSNISCLSKFRLLIFSTQYMNGCHCLLINIECSIRCDRSQLRVRIPDACTVRQNLDRTLYCHTVPLLSVTLQPLKSLRLLKTLISRLN